MGSPAIFSGLWAKILARSGLLLASGEKITNDGEKNYIVGHFDSSSTSPWATSGAGISLSASSSSPLLSAYSMVIAVTGSGTTSSYAYQAFTLDNAYKSRPLSIRFFFEAGTGYDAGDAVVEIRDVTNSTTITPSVTSIPGGSGEFSASFSATTSTSYELRIRSTVSSSAWDLKVDGIKVGPNVLPSAIAEQAWTSYTPVFQNATGLTPTVAQCHFYRIGQNLYAKVRLSMTGTGSDAAAFGFSLPSGLTPDTATFGSENIYVGSAVWFDSSATDLFDVNAKIRPTSSNFITFERANDVVGNTALNGNDMASGDALTIEVGPIAISQWRSSIDVSTNNIEYVYNSSTATAANDTTSFAYGAEGATIQAITALVKRRVRFQRPRQPTDFVFVDVSEDRLNWIPVVSYYNGSSMAVEPFTFQTGTSYGIGIYENISSTDIDIGFGQYAVTLNNGSGTYGAAGVSYASAGLSTKFWRVRKVSGFQFVPISGPIYGITDASTAAGGAVGEVKESQVLRASAVSLTSSTEADVTTVTLQPGDYDISYKIGFKIDSSATTSQIVVDIVQSGSTIGFYDSKWITLWKLSISNEDINFGGPTYRVNISTATTFAMRVRCSYSGGTVAAFGNIFARRAR